MHWCEWEHAQSHGSAPLSLESRLLSRAGPFSASLLIYLITGLEAATSLQVMEGLMPTKHATCCPSRSHLISITALGGGSGCPHFAAEVFEAPREGVACAIYFSQCTVLPDFDPKATLSAVPHHRPHSGKQNKKVEVPQEVDTKGSHGVCRGGRTRSL